MNFTNWFDYHQSADLNSICLCLCHCHRLKVIISLKCCGFVSSHLISYIVSWYIYITSLDFRSLFRHLSHWQYRSNGMPYTPDSSPQVLALIHPIHLYYHRMYTYTITSFVVVFVIIVAPFYCCYSSAFNYRSISIYISHVNAQCA